MHNRRDRQAHVDELSVFADSNRFERFNSLSLANTSQQCLYFFFSIGWRQNGNVLSNDFCRAVSVQSLGGGIPARNDAVQSLTDNRIVGVLNDRRLLGEVHIGL